MPNVNELALAFRAALVARDDAARQRILGAYFALYKRLIVRLNLLTYQIDEARQRGEIFSPSWLYQQDRYQALIAQLVKEMTVLSRGVASEIEGRQADELARGLRDSVTLMGAAVADAGTAAGASVGVSFKRLPVAALESLIGTLGDGSPLMARLGNLPEQAKEDVRKALVEGLATGSGPRAMAAAMRDALGGNATRALTLARTESLRAYRHAALSSYQANSDVVSGWRWISARNLRTCGICWSLDGKVFPLSEPFFSHVNCRCSASPIVKGLPSLQDTGEEAFARLPADQQREILGPAKFDAYKAGEIRLGDLVEYRDDPQWGPQRTEASLALARKRAGKAVASPVASAAPSLRLADSVIAMIRSAPAYRDEFGIADPQKIAAADLGLPVFLGGVPGLGQRSRAELVPLASIFLGRDALDRERLIRAAEALREGIRTRGVTRISLAERPGDAGYVVRGDGNHRIAALYLMGYRGNVPASVQKQKRRP